MRLLGSQVRVAEAATSIDQTKLALRGAGLDQRPTSARTAATPARSCATRWRWKGCSQIGVPYKWGGASPETGFDCSGLMMWLCAKHGVVLPHFAASQYHMGPFVDKSDLQIGDLVFFHQLGHVGMYIGHGYVLHAPHTGVTVMIEPFSDGLVPEHLRGRHSPRPGLSRSTRLRRCCSARCCIPISAVPPT